MVFSLVNSPSSQRFACTWHRAKQHHKRACLVRDAPEDNVQPTASGSVFYGGKSYSPEEWADTVRQRSLVRPAAATVLAAKQGSSTLLSFSDVMSFSGTAPEIVNGRLAMLGFVSAIAAELVSGEGVLRQWREEPTGVSLAFVLFIAGSLVTAFQPKRDDRLGPFTPQAELINGRAAMIGFAALLVIEAVKGSPLI
ncbi:hypothetical protein VOLCADRAFT_103348 [Volvox carteri f. nagariensis]|uniref:Early light-induced protein n=1 Tax=Volvox carteri f. nagariensis TaxID=3068 RepID=D8TLD7_VOLCA|nr:uncharacterized protein VOLCADRAFT_103348 [Volvox carteri f. nagariensis]EFJ51716.1 hypothetical protein VOLCADRAFT_103348 [Volvox carteri f. nagariensis]|eukprot:XP_002947126.1 hypothetical protein VOLCADRAFT_103348 [Volvox carteri f. nagariensis]